MSRLLVCESCWSLWEEPREQKGKGSPARCCVCKRPAICSGPISQQEQSWLETKWRARNPNRVRFTAALEAAAQVAVPSGDRLTDGVTAVGYACSVAVDLLDELEQRYLARIAALEDRVAQLEPPPPRVFNRATYAVFAEAEREPDATPLGVYVGDGHPDLRAKYEREPEE